MVNNAMARAENPSAITLGNQSPALSGNGTVNLTYNTIERARINPYNLAKVIKYLDDNLSLQEKQIRLGDDDKLARVDIESKNRVNNLEPNNVFDYSQVIIDSSIYFPMIRGLIGDPRNVELSRAYNNIRKSIAIKIPIMKRDNEYFSDILNIIIEGFIAANDEILLENEELVVVMIHFMYYLCDIGEKYD